jgi:hypothetical protein
MRLLVAVTVLKEEDIRVRAELIHRWIQIAIDTKTATGNLYGFNNIMLGLCNPQVGVVPLIVTSKTSCWVFVTHRWVMCLLIVTSITSCWVSVTHRWVLSSSFGNVMRHAIEII